MEARMFDHALVAGLCLAVSVVLFMWQEIRFTNKLLQVWKQLDVEGGPFISAQIRFPRRLMRYEFTREFLRQVHVHRMTPKRLQHLLHVLKAISPDIPQSACLYAAHAEVSKDQWTITLQDESYPVLNEQGEIPMGTISMETDFARMLGPEEECPACALDKMQNVASLKP